MASCPIHCVQHQTFFLFYYLFCTHASYPSYIHPSIFHLCSTHLSTHPSCISESYMHVYTCIQLTCTCQSIYSPSLHSPGILPHKQPSIQPSISPVSLNHLRVYMHHFMHLSILHLPTYPFSIPAFSRQPCIH